MHGKLEVTDHTLFNTDRNLAWKFTYSVAYKTNVSLHSVLQTKKYILLETRKIKDYHNVLGNFNLRNIGMHPLRLKSHSLYIFSKSVSRYVFSPGQVRPKVNIINEKMK